MATKNEMAIALTGAPFEDSGAPLEGVYVATMVNTGKKIKLPTEFDDKTAFEVAHKLWSADPLVAGNRVGVIFAGGDIDQGIILGKLV